MGKTSLSQKIDCAGSKILWWFESASCPQKLYSSYWQGETILIWLNSFLIYSNKNSHFEWEFQTRKIWSIFYELLIQELNIFLVTRICLNLFMFWAATAIGGQRFCDDSS